MSTSGPPATADRLERFRNGRLVFQVEDQGPIDGPVVVLLHGFPQNARCWDAVRTQLHARGYRTIAFDQRGYAPGARPRGRFAYRTGALVSDLVALTELFAPVKVSLVGHDWGAVVAWAMAARHPELIASLTTVSVPHTRAFLRSLLSSNQALRGHYMAVFQLPWIPEILARRNPDTLRKILLGSGMHSIEADRVVVEMVPTPAFTAGLNWYRGMMFSHPSYSSPVTVPTTHVWSTRDVSLVRAGAQLCARYVDADFRLEIIEGSHWVPDELPDVLARIIDARVSAF
ncbi:alpha/beta fold hydrolase [Nocardia elegans]|uniref:alpha/beta fold hydrolase n=1 Tax=Nocardia elegans TaxID=300029 RepID=UPI001893E9A9|nr:alpha/beta fold hydrolase [Nocardia elegans]MBF6451074.1 alpha/beta fold hydrolase [Nocardia elegans]